MNRTLISAITVAVAPFVAAVSFAATPTPEPSPNVAIQAVPTHVVADSQVRQTAHDEFEAIIQRLDAIIAKLGGKPVASSQSERVSAHEQLEAIIQRLDVLSKQVGTVKGGKL